MFKEMTMNKTTIAFVILHYLSFPLTEACLDSILALRLPRDLTIETIIIDNASGNGSLEKLKRKYLNTPHVTILENESNLGFSKANNIAFRYAKEHFSPSVIGVLNNDIVIPSPDFAGDLLRISMESGAYVIGPDIFVSRKGIHQNPIYPELPSKDLLEWTLRREEERERRNEPRLTPLRLVKMLLLRIPAFRKHEDNKRARGRRAFEGWKEASHEGVLHGAALFFTERFLRENALPFEPETFLYEEETILALRLKRNAWPSLYTPELLVLHSDDGATDLLTKNYIRKARFLRKHEIDSLRILLRMYEEEPAPELPFQGR